jgi:hypothetical protein
MTRSTITLLVDYNERHVKLQDVAIELLQHLTNDYTRADVFFMASGIPEGDDDNEMD